MDAVSAFVDRLPLEIRRVGGSLPWRAGIAVLALLANIGFYLPRVPASTPGADVPGVDKLVHLGVLALTVWALGRLLAPRRRFPMGWVVLGGLANVLLIEVVQSAFLPERSADPWDALAGVAGVAVGVAAWSIERRRAQPSKAISSP